MRAFTEDDLATLRAAGVNNRWHAGYPVPHAFAFEPPCHLQWAGLFGDVAMGAFSYGVTGHYSNVHIGRYCSIGESVQFGRGDHPLDWVSTSPLQYDGALLADLAQGSPFAERLAGRRQEHFAKPYGPRGEDRIRIGHDVWIGHGAFIKPGVMVGDGAVIGAMSLVTRDVPPYAVVAGQPARVIRTRFPDETVQDLLRAAWWDFAWWDLDGFDFKSPAHFARQVEAARAEGLAPYAPGLITRAAG